MFSKNYEGQNLYIDELSVSYDNLITANSAGALLWTKQIIECLDVFNKDTLDSWFNYFSTGQTKYYFELMNTLR